jgi:hypothetical protein
MVDGHCLEPACNPLFLVQVRCAMPRGDLGFDLRIIRPPIPATLPAARRYLLVGSASSMP